MHAPFTLPGIFLFTLLASSSLRSLSCWRVSEGQYCWLSLCILALPLLTLLMFIDGFMQALMSLCLISVRRCHHVLLGWRQSLMHALLLEVAGFGLLRLLLMHFQTKKRRASGWCARRLP
jgi:hypothetical protein